VSQKNPELHEQALNKAAEVGISSQLDEVEDLDVEVEANPGQLVTGEVEAVDIEGTGMVMEKSLRMEKLEMHVEQVAINPLQAAFGKIELTKPVDGMATAVLTDKDINQAFNSDYIRQMLQNLQVNVNNQPMTIDTQNVNFCLPGNQKVALKATVLVQETNETKEVDFTATPQVLPNGEGIVLQDAQYQQGQEFSSELTQALLDKSSEILDFKNFDLEGMSLRVNSLDVQPGKLVLKAQAHVEKIPSA
jgi:hypothetical protein